MLRALSLATCILTQLIRAFCFSFLSYLFALFLRMVAYSIIKRDIEILHKELTSLKISNSCVKFHRLATQALILAEDHRYYFHGGVDFVAIGRAVFMICRGQKQGASTIEQQLVRTVTNQYKISLKRKAKELMLASTLSKVLTKNETAELYLAIAYFGYAIPGAKLASEKLNINLVCDAFDSYCKLISLLKYPLRKSENSFHFKRWNKRQAHINFLQKKVGGWTPVKLLPN